MGSRLALGTGALLILCCGCDIPSRMSRVEKDEQELRAELVKTQAATDLDLQAKCSKDAKTWYLENWERGRDKDRLLLPFTNHYNKSQNKCFIFVEYHYSFGRDTWMNDMMLWDVYENAKYGNFNQSTTTMMQQNQLSTHESVPTCEVFGKKCATIEEFNQMVRPYLND